MAFTKISMEELVGKRISDLPDFPELNAVELKARFDKISEEIVIPKHNRLAEELEAETAAGNIGAKVPEGITASKNIDSIIKALGSICVGASRVVALFKDILSVSDSVEDRSDLLPTGKAIVDYVKKLGAGDMQTTVYDKDGNGVVDNSEKLGGELPSAYQKVTDGTLQTEAKTIPGAINELFNRKQASTASDIEYNNRNSGLKATNGQGAIDELASNFSTAANDIGDAIAAKGVNVPDGTALSDMAQIITDSLRKKITHQTQTGSLTTQIWANHKTASGTVAFPTPFDGTPIVEAGWSWDGKTGLVAVSNVTRVGFDWEFTYSTGSMSYLTFTVNWTADYSDN